MINLFKIIISIFLAGIIGLERAKQEKTAGLRTTIFISLGATLAIIFDLQFLAHFKDLTSNVILRLDPIRIIAYYIVAIGFVGGNIINKQKNKIKGVTTSALLLPVSFIGFLCGFGEYFLAIFVTAIVYGILLLKYLEIKIQKRN